MSENLIYKHCPTIIAHSIEFRNMKIKSLEEANVLQKIKADEHIHTYVPREQSRKGQNVEKKPLLILLAYMLQMEELEQLDKNDIAEILKKVPAYVEIMLEVCKEVSTIFKMTRGRRGRRIIAKNIITILDFSQNVIQALWKDDDPFLQLPHMNKDTIKKIKQ